MLLFFVAGFLLFAQLQASPIPESASSLLLARTYSDSSQPGYIIISRRAGGSQRPTGRRARDPIVRRPWLAAPDDIPARPAKPATRPWLTNLAEPSAPKAATLAGSSSSSGSWRQYLNIPDDSPTSPHDAAEVTSRPHGAAKVISRPPGQPVNDTGKRPMSESAGGEPPLRSKKKGPGRHANAGTFQPGHIPWNRGKQRPAPPPPKVKRRPGPKPGTPSWSKGLSWKGQATLDGRRKPGESLAGRPRASSHWSSPARQIHQLRNECAYPHLTHDACLSKRYKSEIVH